MKYIFSAILLLAVGYQPAGAQNIPLENATPAGSTAGTSLPLNYNAGGNTAPTSFNFTRTWIPSRPATGFTPPAPNSYGSITTTTTTTYTNGFGQPLQTNTDLAKDQVLIYDNRAMLDKPAYLPYVHPARGAGFRTQAYTEQKAWYNASYNAEGDNAYSRTKSIASGSQHSAVSYAPGKAATGSDRGTTVSAEINAWADGIYILQDVAGAYPVAFAHYQAGQLLVKKTVGQHGGLTYEYNNRNGQLVCKRTDAGTTSTSFLTTYYVYNDLGKISWILPPKAVKALETAGWSGSLNGIYDGLCYHYVYDKYGQVTERAVPDKVGKEYAVYDAQHRPVLSQTPLLQTRGQWAFQVYDNRSRIVFSGFVTSSRTRQAWQDIADGTNTTAFAAGSLEDYLQHECNGAYPSSIAGCDINQYSYYDSYDFPSGLDIYGRSYSTIHNAGFNTSDLYVMPQPVSFVRGLLTATRTRVLGATNPFSGAWTNTVIFYDQESRPIQTQTLYPWSAGGNWDVASTQYTFRGQVAKTLLKHYSLPNCPKTGTTVAITRSYDPGGLCQLKNVTMSLDGGTPVQLSAYDYDDLGRVKTKSLGIGIEKQQYSYNIRGQLTGINAGYVNNRSWPDATFGCELSYDYGFTGPRYDGAIAGMRWRGAGSQSAARAYGYTYDRAGRMIRADFTRKSTGFVPLGSPLWDNSDMDYTVSGIGYDENGNLQSMIQKGMAPGISTPVTVDELSYHYESNSNRLDRVEDGNGVTATTNAGWGLNDFINRNPGTNDYQYDADGNLTADANKQITSIIYNAQDLPLDVYSATGEVHNVYDAAGVLLQKTVITGSTTKVYNYCGPFVYENNNLSHLLHEEGRARWLGTPAEWRFDFFVKDHLGNVRTVVGLDVGQARQYLATHELSAVASEAQVFTLGDLTGNPAPVPGNTEAVRMNGSEADKNIGTTLLLKVMAGDKFNASVSAYYDRDIPEDGEGSTSEGVLGSVISALSGGITELGTDEGLNENTLSGMFSGPELAAAYEDLVNTSTDSRYPRSYLNWALFDEGMNLVTAQSGVKQISKSNENAWGDLEIDQEITAGTNGYLVIFMSNQDPRDVLMDNLKVTYSRGHLLEEQHYYPHGLAIKGGANTPLVNRYLYQGKELQDEAGLQLYDFHARQYDPQIGRFWGIDPADQFPSGYTGMGNDPANQIDPDGMTSVGSGMGSNTVNQNSGNRDWNSMAGEWSQLGNGGLGNLNTLLAYFDEMRKKGLVPKGGGQGNGLMPKSNIDIKTPQFGMKSDGKVNLSINELFRLRKNADAYKKSSINDIFNEILKDLIPKSIIGEYLDEIGNPNITADMPPGPSWGLMDNGKFFYFPTSEETFAVTIANSKFVPTIYVSPYAVVLDITEFNAIIGHDGIHAMDLSNFFSSYRTLQYPQMFWPASETRAYEWEALYWMRQGNISNAVNSYQMSTGTQYKNFNNKFPY